MPSIFTDQTATTTGTALNANSLNTFVVAQSYIVSGGVPGSFSGASLQVTQPATQVVINQGTSATFVNVASTTLTMVASVTQYVDLSTAGSYTVTTAGSPAAGSIRLYQCVTNGSGVTSLTQQATADPVAQSGVQYDSTEASTNDTLAATSSLLNNLNRIRYVLANIQSAAWSAAVSMIPTSQKGAANGVATLNASTQVPIAQLKLNGTPSSPTAVVGVDSSSISDLSGSATAASATAGINGAVPAQVAGYVQIYVTHNATRTLVKVPYFLV